MAKVYARTCDICLGKALRRDSFLINPSSTSKRYLVCRKCGRALANFLKKYGLYKTMRPKAMGSQKERKLKTRRKR